MKNSNKPKFRFNNYDAGDAGIVFLLSLVLPQFLILLAMMICTSATGLPITSAEEGVQTFVNTYPLAYTLVCSLVPQISMLGAFLFVSERKKVNYAKANQISFKNFNPIVMLIVLAIGVVCMFGFSPFVNWFDNLASGFGYKSSVANIDVGTVGKLFGAIFYIGFLPAICEELVFRGVVTNGLKNHGTKVAVVLSGILFALMHQNLQQFVYQLFLGGVMAYIVLKTGNLIYTMLLHFVNNAVILISTHLSGDVSNTIDYSNAWNNIWPFLVMILAIGCVIGLLVLLNFVQKRTKHPRTDLQNKDEQLQLNNEDNLQTRVKDEQTTQIKAPQVERGFATALKNPFVICALVAGVLMWVFSVIASFA